MLKSLANFALCHTILDKIINSNLDTSTIFKYYFKHKVKLTSRLVMQILIAVPIWEN